MQPEGWMVAFREMLPMLEELPPQEHAAIVLRYFNGFSVSQIAEETGRPVGTVTKQLSRNAVTAQSLVTAYRGISPSTSNML